MTPINTQTNGQTDGRNQVHYLPASLSYVVDNKHMEKNQASSLLDPAIGHHSKTLGADFCVREPQNMSIKEYKLHGLK